MWSHKHKHMVQYNILCSAGWQLCLAGWQLWDRLAAVLPAGSCGTGWQLCLAFNVVDRVLAFWYWHLLSIPTTTLTILHLREISTDEYSRVVLCRLRIASTYGS